MRGYDITRITDFGGPNLRYEVTDVPPTQGLLALNTEFDPGNAGTRSGFGALFDTEEAITSIFSWVKNSDIILTTGNGLAYFTTTSHKAKLRDMRAGGTTYDIFTDMAAIGCGFTSGGTRLYCATYGVGGIPTSQGRVVGINDSGAFYTDKLFPGAITYKPGVSNTGTGSITAGTHRIGYIIQSRSGAMGRISPINGSTFDTTSVIAAPGGKQLTILFNTTWPTDAQTVYPVMTTVDNPGQYFIIPDSSFGVPGGSMFPFTAVVDISDEDLKAADLDVTDSLVLFTQDSVGAGPFNPFKIVEYGQRIVYLTIIDGIFQYYISDLQNPQKITADQHVRFLPGNRSGISGFVLDSVLYILGPHWTFADRDNQQLPVQWPTSELVDGQVGALGPDALTVNASKGWAWVADGSGLCLFSGGHYAARPVSYNVDPDWKRINLSAGATVQVRDNKTTQQVFVLVPLDGATSPSHIMMFDYSNGVDPDTIKYSLWSIANFPPGAIEIFQNETTKRLELCVGRGTAGKVLRQKNTVDDPLPYNDDSAAIDWEYETCLLPGMTENIGTVYRHYSVFIRAKGLGNLYVTSYGLDRTKNFPLAPIALAPGPGQEIMKRIAINSEGVSHRFRTNAVDQYALISQIEHLSKAGPSFR